MAPPVQSHASALPRQQGQPGVYALGGAPGEEQAGVKAEAVRPEPLRLLYGVGLFAVQVAGAAVLGEVDLRRPGEAPRQGPAVVAGHVQPQRALGRQRPEAVV